MAPQWTRPEKFKRGVWSVAVAAVICVGAITGAQLKTDKQKKEVYTVFSRWWISETHPGFC